MPPEILRHLLLPHTGLREGDDAVRNVSDDAPVRMDLMGSYPKSVMALEALRMLGLAGQSGFREYARHPRRSGFPGVHT